MKTKVSKFTNIGLRIGIMLLTFVFVYKQILEKHDLHQWLGLWSKIQLQQNIKYLLFLNVLLLFFNILIESYKWKFLVSKLEIIRLNQAFTAVLSGMSVSMFLPNRVGDYLGRVFVLQKASHVKGILATIIGSFAQIIVTFVAGFIGLMTVVPFVFPLNTNYQFLLYLGLTSIAVLFSLLMFAFYFNVRLVKVVVSTFLKKRKKQFMDYAAVFDLYSRSDLIKILSFSILRYLVYTFQFFLMLLIFGFRISYPEALALIAVTYLIITIIPTIAITELGVRGSVTMAVFGMYFENKEIWTAESSFAVLAASSSLWLLNLAFPAILGAFFTYRLKFFRRNIDDV
jgi:uncharacterized membrane protein YbhN (UPF0104 family)